MSSNAHVPVLLGPVLQGLKIKPDGCYVDGTFGRGGHSGEILRQLHADGRLIAIDRDPEAIASAPQTLTNDPRFELIRGEIAQLETIITKRGLLGEIDGLLLDLGVSSPQLDEAERGFSFMRDGPLDMRMDPDAGVPASAWLGTVAEPELRRVLRQYGEESSAARIARAIVKARDDMPISRTAQLARIIEEAAPARGKKQIHPATKTFQAIRIFINGELEQLQATLQQSLRVLKKGGRLCVISFHSLEDRIVKRFIRDASREPEQYRGMPSVPVEFQPQLKPVGKAVTASPEEVEANRRARSARLRIAERR
ncbi:MAG: 16S rRNA (cytosine(1402)-N(4))-methyltransferase RsmH [Gammaproteobacteria bacterium]|nr:16S rRNA (cytosine(1402)-N(4))-methyltransferase RsmH [Gammaproteobacteria bacterium]